MPPEQVRPCFRRLPRLFRSGNLERRLFGKAPRCLFCLAPCRLLGRPPRLLLRRQTCRLFSRLASSLLLGRLARRLFGRLTSSLFSSLSRRLLLGGLPRSLLGGLTFGFEPRLLFGFSRGAFAVRVLATFLQRDVEMIGVWDTVKATPGNDFGIADLPPYVKHAYHAMAIDERRSIFDVFRFNPLDVITERWFAGSHTDVGGGYANHELADIALQWMALNAVENGLIVDGAKIDLDKPIDLTIKPVVHDENNIGWGLTNVFKKSKTVVERLVGAADVLDDTVLFIRDHWDGLLHNSTLSDNQMFMGADFSGDVMV